MKATVLVATLLSVAFLMAGCAEKRGQQDESSDLQAEIENIRRAGEPIEPKDLLTQCPIPDHERQRSNRWMELATLAEAAVKYTDDAKPLPFVGELEVKDDALDGEAAHELRQKARAYLGKHRAALDLAYELRKDLGPVAYPYKFEDGFEAKFPWVQALRSLNRLLAMEGRLRALAGDVEGSIASWHAKLALCESLRSRSCGVSCGVVEAIRRSMLQHAIEQARFNINHGALTDEQLVTMQVRLSEIKPEEELRRVLLGERMIGIVAFQNLEQLFGDNVPKRSPAENLMVRSADCSYFLGKTRELMAYCQLPYPECRKKAETLLNAVIEEQNEHSKLDSDEIAGTALLLPGTTIMSIESCAPAIARRNIALAAVAARRFARDNGRLPRQLDELVPRYLADVPYDPYTANSLLMRTTESGVVISSLGRNEVDDEAVPNVDKDDISWLVVSHEMRRGPP